MSASARRDLGTAATMALQVNVCCGSLIEQYQSWPITVSGKTSVDAL